MNKLTIALPTYNRPAQIIEKLIFFLKEIQYVEAVKIVVSDNASSIKPDKDYFEKLISSERVIYNVNEKNIGLIGNYIRCIETTDTEFVWVVGDDDILTEGIVQSIMLQINKYSDLAIIHLKHIYEFENAQCRKMLEKPDSFIYFTNGTDLVQENFDISRFMKITANVLRTEIAKKAVKNWSLNHAPQSLGLPLYVSVYTAQYGSGVLIDNISFWGPSGKSSWSSQKVEFYLCDTPESTVACLECGIDQKIIDASLSQYFLKMTGYPFKQFFKHIFTFPPRFQFAFKVLLTPMSYPQWYKAFIKKNFKISLTQP
ncbi:glycosyltransferase [Cyanobacterium aponinum UTEX 3222]|uniref:glycosyltransferase n=1 Tax=Cyanobacterium aponinum TaxID=379064 RepID=UPI0030927CE6|nr:glycosyltransferase [Cyanobacterium aponinum UTEX 3222]